MAHVEDGFITFSEDEAKNVRKKLCLKKCRLNMICTGPDSKTSKAEVFGVMGNKPSDTNITTEAACLNGTIV